MKILHLLPIFHKLMCPAELFSFSNHRHIIPKISFKYSKVERKTVSKMRNRDVWNDIEKHMENPKYVKAVYEFIRKTTS